MEGYLDREIELGLDALHHSLCVSLANFIQWLTDYHKSYNLITVLQAWSIGGVLAASLGATTLWRMKIEGWHQKVDWAWIIKGLKVAFPFLLATLALQGIYTVDRYWIEALVGLDVLAAYVLFIGMCNALMSFLDSGVFAFIYPAVIQAWHEQSPINFQREQKRLLVHTFVYTVVFVALTIGLFPFLISWLSRPVYSDNAHLFLWLLLATVLFAISMIPHYALYAQGQDRHVIYSHIVIFIIFIPLTWGISKLSAIMAIPITLCIVFAIMLIWKILAYVALTPDNYQLFRQKARTKIVGKDYVA